MGKYSEFGYEPCTPCPQHTYQDSHGATYCIQCPYGRKTWFRGAKSIEQCRVYHGNFDINNTHRNLDGLHINGAYLTNSTHDRIPVNCTLVGWNVELRGVGLLELYIYRLFIPRKEIQ